VASALFLGACGQLLGISSWVDVGESSDAASDAATDGKAIDATGPTPEGASNVCPSPVAGGAPGVRIDAVGGTPAYCIDATETTMALYQRFLNDPSINPPAGAPPECAWNTEYGFEYQPYSNVPDASDLPVTAVHWCDAWGFCNYWGKHLCGNRADGGPIDPSLATGPASQWEYACAGPNANQFPYGSVYDASACRTGLPPSAGAGPVPTPTCVGGFPGLYDMSGNLEEWENSCIRSDGGDPRWDRCQLRGGTFFFPVGSLDCPTPDYNDRNGGDAGGSSAVTIRCCWEP
jgi:formylglycine-generating enzyme required for sulfatase activity